MKQPLFLGIDIGTQGTKTILSDRNGKILSEAFCSSRLIHPDAATVYEDPEDIFSSVIKTIRSAIEKSGADGKQIAAIGMDAQMAGVMGIDEDFNAVTPLDSWLDTRCAPYTEQIARMVGDEAVKSSGGQIIHSHASKILWWKNEQPDIYNKIRKFVMPNGYVAGRLCGLKADDAFMDYTFLHFNVFSDNLNCSFNNYLLKEFDISPEKMPEIVEPTNVIGTLLPEYAAECGLGENVLIIAGCGDTAASSLGAGITRPGLAYDVAGTASVFACATDVFNPDVKNHTLLYTRSVFKNLFLPIAYISGGGLCLEWFSKLTGRNFKELDVAASQISPGSGGVYFLPHFSGRTCPLDSKVSGAFLGLTTDADQAVIFKAIMESIAYEYKSYLDILTESKATLLPSAVRGIGGGAKSAVFSQIKADVLGVPYHAMLHADSAPAAMAVCAAFSTGYTNGYLEELFEPGNEDIKAYNPDVKRHNDYKAYAEKYLSLLNGFSNYYNI